MLENNVEIILAANLISNIAKLTFEKEEINPDLYDIAKFNKNLINSFSNYFEEFWYPDEPNKEKFQRKMQFNPYIPMCVKHAWELTQKNNNIIYLFPKLTIQINPGEVTIELNKREIILYSNNTKNVTDLIMRHNK